MTITYNNIDYGSNMITFNDVPNILKVNDTAGGTYASYDLQVLGSPQADYDKQYYIEIMGETIQNVLDPMNAINKNFFFGNDNNSTAMSITRALRNCSNVSANFTIQNDGSYVRLRAKSVGRLFGTSADMMHTNISTSYLSKSISDGSAYSPLYGSIVMADIYSNGSYVTTLEKAFYNGETAFNLSPVVNTFTRVGRTVPYTVSLSAMKDGTYTSLGSLQSNYAAQGYMVNQGNKYLTNDRLWIAQNFQRGSSKDADNNTLLYVYQPNIQISFYKPSGGVNIGIRYLDSARNTLYTASTYQAGQSGSLLTDVSIPLSAQYFNQSFFIELTFDNTYTVRYNVIKPVNMTEYGQRICWRNSYGGISFFDFTGRKSETREFEISTYQKSIYDYYTDARNELDKVYDNDVDYEVTLKSHLFEEDGKYVFNDIIQSPEVWTEINGEQYAIILKSVSVEETDNNNVYEATLKYRYSQNPSLI